MKARTLPLPARPILGVVSTYSPTLRTICLLAAFLTGGAFRDARAEAPDPSPYIQFTTGLAGNQVQLTWAASPGLRYRVEKSSDLTDGSGGSPWTQVALVSPMGPFGSWTDPEASSDHAFYRISIPKAEVFSISPAVLGPAGGTLDLKGQCIPDGSFLVLEIEGAPPLFVPLVFQAADTWRAVVSGAFVPGANILSAYVVDGGGTTLDTIDQDITITGTGRALDGPADLPPAAPVPEFASKPVPSIGLVVKKNRPPPRPSHSQLASSGGGEDDDCDGIDDPFLPLGMAINEKGLPGDSKKNTSAKKTNMVRPYPSGVPGEVAFQRDDLVIPTPAGAPLAWTCTYRSKSTADSGMGPGWDFSYNIYIEPIPAAAGASALRVVVHDGGGRADVFHRQSDGSYRCDGLMREGRFTGDVFTLTFADKGTWTFNPLSATVAAGKISSISCHSGGAAAASYAATGKLSSVTDSFGQTLTLTWLPGGKLFSVTDSGGRSVHYAYYGVAEAGGGEGDLKSVSCPTLTGSPPVAGDTVYTYTKGFADDQLNHNLLSVTDGAGRLVEAFTYASSSTPTDIEYDACATHDRRKDGLTGHVTLIKREMAPPAASPPGSYTTFEVDEIGRLTETDCDAMHRVVRMRQYTGFCTPGTPVTSTTNRPNPATRLRSTDPEFYETQCEYNADGLCTVVTLPDGGQGRWTYDRDLRPDCPARERGNARVCTIRSPGGEERTVSVSYQPGFGSLEPACMPGGPIKGLQVKCGRNPGADVIASGFADPGNPIKGMTVKGGRNPGGDVVGRAAPGSPIGGLSIKGGKNPGGNLAGRAPGNPIGGLNIKGGFAPDTALFKEEGGRHTPFHNKYHASAFLGGDSGVWDGGEEGGGCTGLARFASLFDVAASCARGFVVNSHTSAFDLRVADGPGPEDCDDADPAIAAASKPRRTRHKGWDGLIYGNHRQASFPTKLVSAHGQTYTWSYDAKGNCTATSSPIEGAGTEATYDAFGRCTGQTVLNGPGSSFHDAFVYDASSGLLSSIVCDDTGLHLATSIERDTLGRVTRVVDPRGRDFLYEYNPLDQVTVARMPDLGSMPSRISTNFSYDAGGRLVRCDVEHRGATGALDSTNPAYTTFIVRNNRGEVIRMATEERPVDVPDGVVTPDSLGLSNFGVCDITYDDAGQCVRLTTPAACRAQATDAVTDFTYDERGMLHRCIQGGSGSASPVVTELDYDLAGAVVRMALGSAGAPERLFSYDGFHRLASETDPMGNVTTFEYDNAGFVTTSCYGEPEDVPGSTGNTLMARWRMRPRAEVLKSNKTGDPSVGQLAKVPRNILKTYFETGDVPTQDQRLASGGAFFDVSSRDETVIVERFSPGAAEPPALETTVCVCSPAGLLQGVTRDGETIFSVSRDSFGRPIRCDDGTCAVDLVLDQNGDPTHITRTDYPSSASDLPKTYSWTCARDNFGRCTQITDSAGHSRSRAFDSLGRCLSVTDADGAQYLVDYDGAESTVPFSVRLRADVNGDSVFETLGHTYCRSGECRSLTNSNGHSTTFTTDPAGRVVRCDYPDGTSETTTFNPFGFASESTLRDGSRCVCVCTPGYEVASVSYVDVPPGVTPVPDLAMVHDGLGRCVRYEQGSSVVALTFDSCGNQLSENQDGLVVSRTFNSRGRSSITYPDGKKFAEERDELGLLLAVRAIGGTSDPMSPPIVSYDYSGRRVARSTLASGVVTTFTYRGDADTPLPGAPDDSYDACVRCVVRDASSTVLSDTIYRRDPQQRVIRSEAAFSGATLPPGRFQSFTLDRLGRITACVTKVREIAGGPLLSTLVTYTLDLEGRRLAVSGGDWSGPYSQNNALPPGDQQAGQYSTWPGGAIEWDDAGNVHSLGMGSAGSLDFVHDAAGRITAIFNSGGMPVCLNEYDALGRLRVRSTPSGVTLDSTRFVYDGSTCVQEWSDDGSGAGTLDAGLTFACAGGIRVCISTRNGTIYYPHGGGNGGASALARCPDEDCDGRDDDCDGTPEAFTSLVTDVTGGVVERIDCDETGKPLFLLPSGLPSSAGASSIGLRWMAPECFWEPETSLLQMPGSTYSPLLGAGVSAHKTKPKPTTNNGEGKKEYVGHVSLIK